MDKSFSLKILTPEQTFYNGKASSLIVPGEAGSLGVMANHAALVTSLISGKISYTTEQGEKKNFFLQGEGFLEVYKNVVNVLLSKAPQPLEEMRTDASHH